MDDPFNWLALNRAPGIGARILTQLLDRFGSIERVMIASSGDLRDFGLKDDAVKFIQNPDPAVLAKDLKWLKQDANSLLTIDSDSYPDLLRELPDPPPLLFLCGDPAVLNLPQLAIVGSRRPTPAGEQTARRFAHHLAENGLTITSGLAAGIDSAAHSGALKGNGLTLAVMGTGVDRIYPADNKKLAHEIVDKGGLLVSELPLGSPPLPSNFPRRNRIISGLTVGTLVVEATTRSGSLITARLASEQGREVFAIPGSIHNSQARGCHALIRKGAKLVETAHDIVEELAPLLGSLLQQTDADKEPAAQGQPAGGEEYAQLLECMGFDPISVDELVQRSGLQVAELSSMLLLLELEGHVSSAPGGLYCRIR